MNFTMKFAAASALAMVAFAPVAQAQGYDDDYGYRRQTQRQYCYNHPYSDRCADRGYAVKRKPRAEPRDSRCASSRVHSVGKAWALVGMARASALKAWEKEVRVEFGSQYSSWGRASSKSITCGPSGTGIGQLCEAKGLPCR